MYDIYLFEDRRRGGRNGRVQFRTPLKIFGELFRGFVVCQSSGPMTNNLASDYET